MSKKLKHHIDHLEELIDDRTRGLKTANNLLKDEIKVRTRIEDEKELLIIDLRKALDEIKTLKGILPICSNCKKIRDDEGYWNQIESYISSHTNVDFTHSICPDCVKKLYPEYVGMDDKDENPIK